MAYIAVVRVTKAGGRFFDRRYRVEYTSQDELHADVKAGNDLAREIDREQGSSGFGLGDGDFMEIMEEGIPEERALELLQAAPVIPILAEIMAQVRKGDI